jgi:hypothetical protein
MLNAFKSFMDENIDKKWYLSSKINLI